MPRPIEHRTRSSYPAAQVFAALTDEEFLRERLRRLGGKRSELASYTTSGGTTRYALRQTIDAQHVPSVARTVIRGDLVIERVESWTGENGQYDGTVDAHVPHTPGSARAVTSLLDVDDGSELLFTGTVKVSVPLVGGRIEEMIVQQLTDLLDAEGEFTQHWLESRDAPR